MRSRYFILAVIVSAFFVVSCQDANFKVIDNSIYITDASGTEKTMNITFDPSSGAELRIPIRLAKLVDHDVQYKIELAPDELVKFNEKYGTRYNAVDAAHLDLGSAQNVIEAGSVSVFSYIKVDNFDTEGKQYAVPVKITSLTEDIDASADQGVFIYVLAKKLEVMVPKFKYTGGDNTDRITAKPDPAQGEGWNIYLPEWTLECWCRFDGYTMNNQAIFAIYGIDQGFGDYGIYVRFGDANSPYNYFQWKAWGAQLEGERDLVANEWYHWALQYDGASIIVYRNGEEYLRGTIANSGEPWMINEFKIIGAHQNWRNSCNMSQIRLWNKAITQAQINNNMYYEIDAENPDLVAFWRMDEGAANFAGEFIDATGNGHDMVVPFFGASNCPVTGWEGPVTFD